MDSQYPSDRVDSGGYGLGRPRRGKYLSRIGRRTGHTQRNFPALEKMKWIFNILLTESGQRGSVTNLVSTRLWRGRRMCAGVARLEE